VIRAERKGRQDAPEARALSYTQVPGLDRGEVALLYGAIIGFGFIAEGHLRGYEDRAGLSVTAVVDPSAERRRCAAAGGLRDYADIESLFAAERPEFLDICSPPNTHAAYIAEALRRGVPALCEKPVFVPDESPHWDVVADIVKSGTVVYPCSNYKFAPVFSEVRNKIESGYVGDVTAVRVRILRRGHARGVAEWNPDWRRDPVISAGGILRDHGPHALYLATSLTGLQPTAVSCIAGNLVAPQISGSEDTVLLRVRCEGGAEIEVSLSWASAYRDSYYVISGSKNSLTVHNDDFIVSGGGRISREGVVSEFDDPSHSAWFSAMFADFESLLADPDDAAERLPTLLGEAALCSDVIDAGYASAAQAGEWVGVARPTW
jgi:predicted dehydrogenase